MKFIRFMRGSVVALASMGMVLSQFAFAASPQAGTRASQPAGLSKAPLDVRLAANGRLRGQVVDARGNAESQVDVAALQQGKLVAVSRTDETGCYALEGLQTGVYQVVTSKGDAVLRAWTFGTAPPAAQPAALIVNGDQVVRGQSDGSLVGFLANPWVLGGIVAAAVAIPLLLDDNNDDDDAS